MICHKCGKTFKKIGTHWHHNPTHRPDFTPEQMEILKGILMGDGTIDRNGKNPRMKVDMTNKQYLVNIEKKFGNLGKKTRLYKTASESAEHNKNTGFSPEAKEKTHSAIYRWRSVKHPQLKSLSDWYDKKGKTFPENIELTPKVLKHWYVCDGTLQNGRIQIALTNEINNKKKIESLFEEANLPKPNGWGEIQAWWSKKNSSDLLDYMGKPIKGFEYKW